MKIVRAEREVGFLDLPGWALDASATPLPEFAGTDNGLALIVELRGSPVACVVYRLKQDTLDITHPTRLTWERRAESLSPERAAICLEGVVMSHEPEPPGDFVSFRWVARSYQERQRREGWRVALKVNDEGLEASLRWDAFEGSGFGEGYFDGFFRSESPGAQVEGEFRAEFYLKRPGYARGYARSSNRGEASGTDAYFELESYRGSPFARSGYLRFRGAGRMQNEEDMYSIPWLLQKAGAALGRAEGEIPFAIWIGRVSYDATASELHSDAAVRRILAYSLLENRPISTRDVLGVARWLQFQVAPQDVSSASRVRDLLRTPSPGYRVTAVKAINCGFTFDESVPPTKALQLLVLFAQGVRERGGRLCFESDFEE